MTIERADALWNRVLAVLHERGIIGEDETALTPAEVAAAAARLGDTRVQAFVTDFYYPLRYGHLSGGLSLDAAESLVDDIAGASEATHTAGAQAGTTDCSICGRRPAAVRDR
jgi:hypothetical protein